MIEYSFVQKDNGSDLSFQSTTNVSGTSFTTEKSLVSFYSNFSEKSFFDSGLLPVDGSGLLSIRSAGPHTQIGYQHKPGMYYINWGGYEGDPRAAKIYVAQPYRIVIADLYNGNILGARTFYSPIPITYANAPLYHVNLPNINCKGYRGNGVGWICLYHNEDISDYPFNEKVAKILDRCSGTEAYNDANMSETDGPNIYRSYGKPSYLHDPQEWQNYSEENGFEWTLDPDIWIPVLVNGIDEQDRHNKDGVPLTYGMAVTGNYQAYYTDPIKPKPVNLISRSDLNFDEKEIFNWFKQAYNSSVSERVIKENPFDAAEKVRIAQSLADPVFSKDVESYVCECCNTTYTEDDDVPSSVVYQGKTVCQNCLDNGDLVFVHHISDYVIDNGSLPIVWVEDTEQYYLTSIWHQKISCAKCLKAFPYDKESGFTHHGLNLYASASFEYDPNDIFAASPLYCSNCIPGEDLVKCHKCYEMVPKDDAKYSFKTLNTFHKNTDDSLFLVPAPVCNYCYYYNSAIWERNFSITEEDHAYCLCGEEILIKDFKTLDFIQKMNHHPHYYAQMSSSLGAAFSNAETHDFMDTVNKLYALELEGQNVFISNHHRFKFDYNALEYASVFNPPPSNLIVSAMHITTTLACTACVNHLNKIWSKLTLMAGFGPGFLKNKFGPTLLDPQKLKNLYGTKITVH